MTIHMNYPQPGLQTYQHRSSQGTLDRQRLRKDDGRGLRTLYTKVLQSKERMFLVRRPNDINSMSNWEVVQVDLDGTDPDRVQKLGE